MTERTDAPILLRLAYQAMLKAGLPVDDILHQMHGNAEKLAVNAEGDKAGFFRAYLIGVKRLMGGNKFCRGHIMHSLTVWRFDCESQ